MIILKDIGESFTDTHPIILMLGDGRTIFIVMAILAIAFIITTITSVEVSYNNKKIKKSICGKLNRNGFEFHHSYSWSDMLSKNR